MVILVALFASTLLEEQIQATVVRVQRAAQVVDDKPIRCPTPDHVRRNVRPITVDEHRLEFPSAVELGDWIQRIDVEPPVGLGAVDPPTDSSTRRVDFCWRRTNRRTRSSCLKSIRKPAR